jgi:transcriptional regulator with XRE-family HTH domain
MNITAEIRRELKEQMIFQSELASRMNGNTMTRIKDLSNILKNKREPGAHMLEEIAEGLGCEWKLVVKTKVMKDYVIFDKGTPEYPGVYQVRAYLDGVPDFSTTMLHSNLDHIREKLKERGMECVGLGGYDHPLVKEVWVGEAIHPLEVL